MCAKPQTGARNNPIDLSKLINLMASVNKRVAHRAWASLQDETFNYLCDYISRSIGGEDEKSAQDPAQDTLLKAFIKANQYRGTTNNQAFAWLRRIAFNATLAEQEKNDKLEKRINLSNIRTGQYNRLQDTITAHDWKEFLNTLDERAKRIAEKKFSYTLKQSEIAKEENISEARVSQIIKDIVVKAALYFGYRKD